MITRFSFVLIAALIVSAACAHSPGRSDSRDAAFDYDDYDSDSQPVGTYSFMMPTGDDWDSDWPDSASSTRADARNTVDSVSPETRSATPATARRRASPPADSPDLDMPTGMVVVYDDAMNGDGWLDSGAGRQASEPRPSQQVTDRQAEYPSAPPSELAPDLPAPDSARKGAGAEYVVQRRERPSSQPSTEPSTTSSPPASASPNAQRGSDAGADDPFARLQRDLQEAGVEESRPARARSEEPATDSLWMRSQETSLPQRPGDDQRMAPGREAGILGVHAVAGAGVLVARDPQGGHGAHFAYGLNVGWNPDFAPQVGLDVGFWRAGARNGTEFASVGTSYHHYTVRAFWQPPLPNNMILGAGGGVVLTQSIVNYDIGGSDAESVTALSHRPGLEATLVAGTRLKPLEVRVEMRTLLRGGMRLDFLPTVSLGASF